MTKQEIKEKFREEYKKRYKDILSDEIINEGNKWFEDFLDTAYEEGAKQERERIIKFLEKIEHQKWDDAEHCSCLAYAIGEVKEKLE